jgi:hypothetical protein
MLYTPVRNTAKSKYSHIRAKNSQKGGLTVAWREIGDNLVYSISICSEQDMFNKKLGRDLCDARLDSISVLEDGSIQVPLNIAKYITVIDLPSAREFLVKSKFYLEMFTLKKAIDVANAVKFEDLSDNFIMDLFFAVVVGEFR